MGWLSDFVSDPAGTVTETVNSAIDTTLNAVTKHPLEVAAVAAGGYYGVGALGATEATGAAALAPVVDSSAPILVGDISPYAAASSNAAFESGLAASQATSSGLTWGQGIAATNAALNLATSGIKIAALGKTMNASTPTVDGLTGGLAASPIQTPSGLITTTPQGPLTAGAVVQSGFMGMDNQTLMVIGAAAIGLFWLYKSGNLKG